jgi:hypothetical protein
MTCRGRLFDAMRSRSAAWRWCVQPYYIYTLIPVSG